MVDLSIAMLVHQRVDIIKYTAPRPRPSLDCGPLWRKMRLGSIDFFFLNEYLWGFLKWWYPSRHFSSNTKSWSSMTWIFWVPLWLRTPPFHGRLGFLHGISVGFPWGQHIITVITLRRKTGTMVTQPTKWWYVTCLDTMRWWDHNQKFSRPYCDIMDPLMKCSGNHQAWDFLELANYYICAIQTWWPHHEDTMEIWLQVG